MSYTMYAEDVTGLTYASDTLVSGQSTTYNYYDLTSIGKLATALGDGFYADEVTNENGFKIIRPNSTTIDTVISSKTLPVLRHSKYANVGIFFELWTGTLQTTSGKYYNVVNLTTGDLLSYGMLSTSGTPADTISRLSILNASADVKAIMCGNVTGKGASLILAKNHIVCNTASGATSNIDEITCISGDGTAYTEEYYAPFVGSNRIEMLPFSNDSLPNANFKGIYIMLRTPNKERCNFTKDGRMYFSVGTYTYQNPTAKYLPYFVISDEVQEVGE